VKDAVNSFKQAGIMVRMATGDNLVTSTAVAIKCGIITEAEANNGVSC